MNRFAWVPVLVALAGTVACSKGGVKEFTPSAEEKAQATEVVQDTQSLQALKADLQGDSALGAFSQIQSGASYLTSQQLSRNSSSGSGLPSFLVEDPVFRLGECAVVSGQSVTYNNCDYGSGVINGHITVSGDVIDIDVTIGFSSSGTSGDYRYHGAITVTDTLIDGALGIDYDISSVSYNLDVRYSQVQLADGCPVGGELRVEVDTSVSGYGSIGASSAVVEIAFGPTCGAMTMKGG